jgi:cytosine/adenosine deaminase-related metal-dependent hydrolase
LPVSGPPIRDGYVQVEGDRILAVGALAELRGADPNPARRSADSRAPASADALADLGDCILTPGLVNAHTHLELTCYAGALEPAPFWEWIPQLVRLRAAPGQIERESQGVVDGARQSLGFGVTCVGDISRRNVHWRGLRPLPIRKVCYVELLSLADDPPRNPAELRAAVAEVEEDALLTVGVTPHAPYSVPGHEIAASIALAHELGRPWTTHWMETREECAFLRGEIESPHPFLVELLRQCRIESPRRSPLSYLEACRKPFCHPEGNAGGARAENQSALQPSVLTSSPSHSGTEEDQSRDRPAITPASPGLLAHMNYPETGDAARVAAMGLSVAYCPRAHHFFGHPPHPYRDYLDAGVNLVLGTDSAASNWSLSVLAEAQFVRRNAPNPPASDVLLELITINPARALGLGAAIGTLEPGKQADLAAFRCPADVADPVTYLVDHAPRPTKVWTAGELRIANRE